MILVFAASAVEANRWALAHRVRGAKCFGDVALSMVGVVGLRFLPHDDIYVLPSTDPVIVDLIRARVALLDPPPRLHVLPGGS